MIRGAKYAVWTLLLIVLASTIAYTEESVLKLATTTSTENSGLLDSIVPQFEKSSGYRVHIIAVGTGRALRHGAAGDVDCVLVHSKAAEDEFMESGFGVDRRQVMYNDFIILGPLEDPAGVGIARSATEAMSRIAVSGNTIDSRDSSRVLFISRGDNSGTHDKELLLWPREIDLSNRKWYLEAGQGMAQVLVMASEKQSYTICDRGTYLSLKERLESIVLFESDPVLVNPYSVIAINPEVHPRVNYKAATAFISWITSLDGQTLIADFRLDDEPLFHPSAREDQ